MWKLNNDKDIWTLALHILGRRSHSEYELRQKLASKEYVVDQIDHVINRLLTYGYINDHKLATLLFKKLVQAGKYSFNNIICKLKQRGLPDDVIKAVTSSYDSEEEMISALKIVNNRFKSLDGIGQDKIYRFLGMRGFSATTIHKVFQQLYHGEIE